MNELIRELVEALEWRFQEDRQEWVVDGTCYAIWQSITGGWFTSFNYEDDDEPPSHLSLDLAKAAFQRYHEQQACAQLEVGNG
jgi:hypothetical protein